MRNLVALSCCLFLSVGCDSLDDEDPATSATSSPEAELYDEGLRKQPCSLLTPEMVAAVGKVPADQLEQREMSGMCMYSWDGGQGNIAFIKTYESIDKAIARFETEHKSMSGAEVKAVMDEIGTRTKEKLEEDAKAGEQVPDPKHVDPVVGGMGESMAGGITFEALEGLGDMAVFETTRHETKFGGHVIVSYANKLDVLVGNLSFDVSFAFDGEARMYKDENIALARAVLDGLPK